MTGALDEERGGIRLQAYLDCVRRRLEHLNGRAFGTGSDYLVGIVVNVDGI